MPAGRFITFEGIDGSGKTTQAQLLSEALSARGEDVILTREPGGSPGAEEVRRLLVDGAPDRWSPETETLLFTAARRDHVERTIAPALEAGRTVVCDRFVDSTRVYQGAVRADLRGFVDTLHALAVGREPDLTFIIDIDADAAVARTDARAGGAARYETLGAGFQAALREGYRALAAAEPRRCRLVAGDRSAEVIADEVLRLALS